MDVCERPPTNKKVTVQKHIQADKKEKEGDSSCFDAQVGALLSMNELVRLSVDAVRVDAASSDNIILDTCRESEAAMDFDINVFRGIPGK